MKNKWLLLLLGFVFSLQAQVEITGSVDFIAYTAGKDSKFITNSINNDFTYPYLSIKQFNLFLSSELSESFFFEGRIEIDNLGTGSLTAPNIALANVSWDPEDSPVSITVGRFITPFGLYPQRQLAVDNSFITPPLAYGYFNNISNSLGFTPGLGDNDDYVRSGNDNVGMPLVYFCGYATGGLFNWTISEDVASLELGVSNIAIASPLSNTNQANFNVLGRLVLTPFPYWTQGFSGSYGSFFRKTEDNAAFSNLNKYREAVFGTDWVIAYSYFELSGEAIYSMWNVPWWSKKLGEFFLDDQGNLKEYKLENYSVYADFRYEPPFLTGSYIAVRYEINEYPKFDDDVRTDGNKGLWDNEVSRYSIGIGYKLQRSVLLKVVYLDQTINNHDPELEDYVLESTLTVSF